MHKTLLAAPVIAGLALTAGTAAAQTVKIGVVSTYSGPTAQQGDMMNRGWKLYDKLHQKDLPAGVKVEIIERDDTGANPETSKRLAQEFVTRDHVNLLTGFVWSPNFMSVAPVATEAKLPVVSLNAAAIQAVGMSPYMVRTSFTLTQQAYPLGKWAAKQGYKKAYTAASDYAPGNEGADAFAKSFTEAGGQVLGQVKFPAPPTTPDFAPFLQRVKDAKPDLLYIFVPAGPQATAIMKAARDLDLKGAGITLISTEDLVPDEEMRNIGDQAVGLVTSGIYTSDAARPANKEFVAAWYKEYGDKMPPDFESADAWVGMKMIYDFIGKTKGKFSGDEAMKYFSTWKDDNSPKGPVMIDPATRNIVQNVYMRRVENQGGKLVDVEFENLGMMNALGQPYAAAK
ncbi:MAG TPA: ABC transporter substrate-binding protein [Stellaceae bacterium]|nr:ABC transporter substrate-binding protein [Stellaceae bacterium]